MFLKISQFHGKRGEGCTAFWRGKLGEDWRIAYLHCATDAGNSLQGRERKDRAMNQGIAKAARLRFMLLHPFRRKSGEDERRPYGTPAELAVLATPR